MDSRRDPDDFLRSPMDFFADSSQFLQHPVHCLEEFDGCPWESHGFFRIPTDVFRNLMYFLFWNCIDVRRGPTDLFRNPIGFRRNPRAPQ
eukprot:1135162-Pyramimonas_sp.AAC.1